MKSKFNSKTSNENVVNKLGPEYRPKIFRKVRKPSGTPNKNNKNIPVPPKKPTKRNPRYSVFYKKVLNNSEKIKNDFSLEIKMKPEVLLKKFDMIQVKK